MQSINWLRVGPRRLPGEELETKVHDEVLLKDSIIGKFRLTVYQTAPNIAFAIFCLPLRVSGLGSPCGEFNGACGLFL